jgi:PKD repeat protein
MIKRVDWDFGDGKRAKQAQTTHTYAAPGTYTVTLSVTDRKDVVSNGTFQIVVE